MKKTAIIGGGIAGLSAGCYAQMNGYDTEIFEMHTGPGGLCTAWKRKGYTFDICIHWLVGSHPDSPFHLIWQELGALQGREIYYKKHAASVFLKDKQIDFSNNPEKLENELKAIAPEDSALIEEFTQCVRKFGDMMNMPLSKPKEFFTIIDKIKMMRYYSPFFKVIKKYGNTTINEFADMFKNPSLRKAFRSFGQDSSMPEFFVIPFTIATEKFGSPQGGSLSFAKSIGERFISLGGTVHYGSKINKILTANNKAIGIKLEDGSEINADIVISAADGYDTIFRMLEGKYINKKLADCYENEPLIPSYLQVSIGVDMDVSDVIPPGSMYNLIELEKPAMIAGEAWKYLHIQNYSVDPGFAPKGKTTLVVGYGNRLEYWKDIASDRGKYKQEKNKIEKAIIAALEEIIPGITQKIEVIDIATPASIVRYTGNREGSIMGFANPFKLNLPRRLPGLIDFYMAGQWTGDNGVPGAAQSGRDIIQLICRKDKKRFLTTIAK